MRRSFRVVFSGRLRRLALLIAAALLAAVVVRQMSILDRLMVYFPERELASTPAALGMDYEDVHLTTSDGTRIHAWHVPAESDTTLLWFHGNAGNVSHRVENIAMLNAQVGVGVFIIDYRGYGLSGGSPSERGLYDDAQAAFDYLTGDLGLDPVEDVVLFGRSLGVGVAVEMATRHAARGLIIESGFTSVREMAKVGHAALTVNLLTPLIEARYDSLTKIPEVKSPVMVLHGDRDETVPFEMAGRLYDAAPEPKRFYPVPGARHNDVYAVGGRAYYDALRRFIEDPGSE